MTAVNYAVDDASLTADEFWDLCAAIWRTPPSKAAATCAIRQTINITARDGSSLVGCARILTDGHMFAAICDILILTRDDTNAILERLLELAYDRSPTGLMIGVQRVSSELMQRLEWQRGPTAYFKRKAPAD